MTRKIKQIIVIFLLLTLISFSNENFNISSLISKKVETSVLKTDRFISLKKDIIKIKDVIREWNIDTGVIQSIIFSSPNITRTN